MAASLAKFPQDTVKKGLDKIGELADKGSGHESFGYADIKVGNRGHRQGGVRHAVAE
jgi:hypothetical protein